MRNDVLEEPLQLLSSALDEVGAETILNEESLLLGSWWNDYATMLLLESLLQPDEV